MTNRLERLINLVIALRESRVPLTAEDVRERVAGYGAGDRRAFRRMFERDKADLRDLGVPVETLQIDAWGDQIGYRIDANRYDLPPVSLEADEVAALALAVQATGLWDEAGTGLRKLEVASGEDARAPTGAAPGVEVDLAWPRRDELIQAQQTRTPVRFAYRRGGQAPGSEAEIRTVEPHALVHRRGRWYLVGHDRGRDARRAFRLDRIVGEVEAAGPAGAFPPPDSSIDVGAVVPGSDQARVEAEVAAHPDVAWQVARRARGGGRPVSDGWTAFTVLGRDHDDVVSWALEFGPEVEVIGPPALRDRAVERLRALAEAA